MKIVCIGDSLTYGLGIPVNENWAALLGRELGFEVVNKGVNGDTSGGMLARLERDVLSQKPDIVFIMGGANDFIMGCGLDVVKANIMAIIHQLRALKIKVIVAAQPSCDVFHIRKDWAALADFAYVARMIEQMAAWLEDFCRVFDIPLVSVFDSFSAITAGREQEYYIDGIHPNKKGHRLIADIIIAAVRSQEPWGCAQSGVNNFRNR